MSTNVVNDLLKHRWTIRRIARAINAPESFVDDVRAKTKVLSEQDVEALAAATGTTAHLLLLNAVRPVKPELRPLFDVVRRQLELSATPATPARPKTTRKSRSRFKAA